MFPRRSLAALALSLLLLFVQGTASAHELDHATGTHDAPSCALHLFANDLPGSPVAEPAPLSLPRLRMAFQPAAVTTPTLVPLYSFAARAPPLFS